MIYNYRGIPFYHEYNYNSVSIIQNPLSALDLGHLKWKIQIVLTELFPQIFLFYLQKVEKLQMIEVIIEVMPKSAMASPRPLKLFNVALLRSLKNAILEQNRLHLQKRSKLWPSKWRFFKNVALDPIWVGYGWPKRKADMILKMKK